jgi:phage baseplate assembly protein V
VLLLAPGGELVCAVVLPAVYQAAHPAPASAGTVHRVEYSDGTSIEYDRAAHKLKVDCVGDIEAKATLSVKVDAGTSIKATSGTSAEINTGTTLTATVGTNLTANVTGNANLTAAAVNITATAINLTGAVNITGLTTATGDVVAMGKSLVTHTHNYNPGPGAPTPSLPPN